MGLTSTYQYWLLLYTAVGTILAILGAVVMKVESTEEDWNASAPDLPSWIKYFAVIITVWPVWVVVIIYDVMAQRGKTGR